jgi:hypothetical protein
VLGRTEPRLWTPPLRPLTPDTSYGFDVCDFARGVLRHPYDPWQEWAVIHAGELLYDGRPRFRIVIILVARQNGKTETPVVLSAYWQFIEQVPLILGTSTKLDYAKESWNKVVKLINKCEDPEIVKLRGPAGSRSWTRNANGEQESWTRELDGAGNPIPGSVGSRYKIAASNAEGGRSLTIDRLILDELRQHHDYSAWDAAEPATAAVWDAQIFALSNAGDDTSVVLNDHREAALEFIEWWDENGSPEVGELLLRGGTPAGMRGDFRLGLFEWSAPVGSDPTDVYALAQANPNMNRRLDGEALVAAGARALAKGGLALSGFYTEKMCIKVPKLDPAINTQAWAAGGIVGTLDAARSRVALCIDVSPDELHCSLIAAAVMADDQVRVEAIQAWEGPKCVDDARRDLPALVRRVRPQVLGWFPNGPAAPLGADLKPREGRRPLLPTSVRVEEIRGELATVCMGLAEQVQARKVLHSNDPLIDAHIGGAERLRRGATWVFSRKGGHCDAAYGVAGAVHLARTLPAPVGKPRLVTAE